VKRIIVSCDQSTGASSAFGIAVYDPNTQTILQTYQRWPTDKQPVWKRIKQITDQLKHILEETYKQYGPLEIRCENFVMRARSGQILAWSVGAIIAIMPPYSEFCEVHNIKNKVAMTGNNGASKLDMGTSLLARFKALGNQKNIDLIQNLIDNKEWDAIDACCIAVYDRGDA